MLTEEQRSTLREFQSITNSNVEEGELINILDSTDWSIEPAILLYFELFPAEANNNITRNIRAMSQSGRLRSASGNNINDDRLNNNDVNGRNFEATPYEQFVNNFSAILNSSNERGNDVVNDIEAGDDEMPGAFRTESELNRHHPQPSKLHTMVTKTFKSIRDVVLFSGLFLLLIIYKLMGFILVLFVRAVIPVLSRFLGKPASGQVIHGRTAQPGDIGRKFIIEFDEAIGNKRKHLSSNPGSQTYLQQLEQSQKQNEQEHLQQDSRRQSDSSQLSQRLISDIESMEIRRPDFLECSYSQAIYFAKHDVKWLMIYIQSDEHDDTPKFVNEILLNSKFLNFINERNMLCWGGDIKQNDAFQVANAFKITKLPFIGLLCLTVNSTPTGTGVVQSTPTMSLVLKIQGIPLKSDSNSVNVDKVINKMHKAYQKYNPTLVSLIADRNEREAATNIRRRQDEAYERSLALDRARAQQRERERRERAEAERREQDKKQWLKWRKSQLFPEPAQDRKGEYARIAIRLPDGKRITRRFEKSCTIEEIYAFIECNYLNDVEDVQEDQIQRPFDYAHNYNFNLVQIMPKAVLECYSSILVKDCNLTWPNGNLVVEFI